MKKVLVFLLISISINCSLQSQTSIIDSLQQALDTAQTNQAKFRILNLLCQHTTPKDKTLAMRYATIYDSLAHLISDVYQIGRAKVLIGSIDFMSGEYNKATEAFLSAMSDFESTKDSAQIGSLYNNMSAVAWAQNDTMGTIRYLQQAIPYYTGSTKIRRLIINHTNLGNMLKVTGQYAEAEEYLLLAIEYIHQMNLDSELGGPYAILADMAVKRNRYEQSELYCNNALKYLSPTKDAQLIVGVWRTKADVEMQKGNLDEAKKHLDEAQKIVDVNNLRIIETGLISHWMEYYVKKGDFAKAYDHSERLRLTRDSILNIERDRNITELRQRFEADKKEKEIAFLNMKNELNVVNMQASKRQSTFLLIGLLLFIVTSIFLFKLFRKIKNQHQTISITLKEKDTLLREIHHRVKNNLQVISSLLSLQAKYILDENALDALRQGQDRVRSMALIHQDLYQSNNLQGVNAQVYLTKLVENLLRSYKIRDDEIRLEIQVDPVELDVDTMIPLGLMMNELISNALKHAFKTSKDPMIKLILADQNKDLYIEIADNGTGVDDLEAMQNKSFGFSLIKMFATKLKAELEIENREGFRVKMKIRQFQKAS